MVTRLVCHRQSRLHRATDRREILGIDGVDENAPHRVDVGRGRLLPSVSVEQYAATLGRWFGISATDLPLVLPRLGNFGSADLGFMQV